MGYSIRCKTSLMIEMKLLEIIKKMVGRTHNHDFQKMKSNIKYFYLKLQKKQDYN
jgi:hydrogenase maturation factor HypE